LNKNVYRIYSDDGEDIIKIINELGEFIISRNVIFLHSDKGLTSVKNKFIKQKKSVSIEKITDEYSNFIPDQAKSWIINDKSDKILDHVFENKEEFENKVLNHLISSLEDLLSEVKDLKKGREGGLNSGTGEITESSGSVESVND
jgi:hypothetical protein